MNANPNNDLEADPKDSVRDYASHVADEVRDRAGKALTASDHYVRENPWPIVLSAAGVGLLIGYALASKHEPTLRERYLDDPVDHARDLLHALLAPAAGRLQHHYGSARSAVHNAADRLHEVDPAKLVDPVRLVRKLRFW